MFAPKQSANWPIIYGAGEALAKEEEARGETEPLEDEPRPKRSISKSVPERDSMKPSIFIPSKVVERGSMKISGTLTAFSPSVLRTKEDYQDDDEDEEEEEDEERPSSQEKSDEQDDSEEEEMENKAAKKVFFLKRSTTVAQILKMCEVKEEIQARDKAEPPSKLCCLNNKALQIEALRKEIAKLEQEIEGEQRALAPLLKAVSSAHPSSSLSGSLGYTLKDFITSSKQTWEI